MWHSVKYFDDFKKIVRTFSSAFVRKFFINVNCLSLVRGETNENFIQFIL